MVLKLHSYHFCGQNRRGRTTKVTFGTHEYHQLELVYPTQNYGNRLHHTMFFLSGIRMQRRLRNTSESCPFSPGPSSLCRVCPC
jgi:hypothetical protein